MTGKTQNNNSSYRPLLTAVLVIVSLALLAYGGIRQYAGSSEQSDETLANTDAGQSQRPNDANSLTESVMIERITTGSLSRDESSGEIKQPKPTEQGPASCPT